MWKLSWMCKITKKHDLIQNQVKKLSFDWFGWNASESEVGWSYGGHEENEKRWEEIYFEMKCRKV